MALKHTAAATSESSRFAAVYFNGESGRPHPVDIILEAEGLTVKAGHGVFWPYARLRVVDEPGSPGPFRLAHGYERLEAQDPNLADALLERLPTSHPDPAHKRRQGYALLLAIVALFFALYLSPQLLAQTASLLSPPDLKIRFGESMVRGLPYRRCSLPAAQQSLDRLAATLNAAAPVSRAPLRVNVIDDAGINAAAFPGGQIVVTRGLVESAPAAEVMAAMLAEALEAGAGDGAIKLLIKRSPLPSLMALFLGTNPAPGVNAALGNILLHEDPGVAAETALDAQAVQRLRRAGISPQLLPSFLGMAATNTPPGSRTALLGSYSDLKPRLEALQQSLAGWPPSSTPPLTEADWSNVKAICRQTAASGTPPGR